MSAPKTITHLLPTGAIILWGGADMPSGFLLCNGASVSRSDYPDLAAALGETGSTFSLPDYRDRVPQGAGTVSPNVGVSAGLPEVSGSFEMRKLCNPNGTPGTFAREVKGCFHQTENDSAGQYSYGVEVYREDFYADTIHFISSSSNSIYSASDSVQMAAYTNHFLIKA